MLEGNVSWKRVQNFKSISSKMAEIYHKTCQKQALFTSLRDLTVIFRILFFARFWRFKKCFRVIFRVLCENLTHRKWYLQMSVTLSMPIHWLCLRLTSKFYSPMSPSPKSRKFWLWPDLWRHQWPPGQIFDLVRVVHVQGYRMAFEILKSVQ